MIELRRSTTRKRTSHSGYISNSMATSQDLMMHLEDDGRSVYWEAVEPEDHVDRIPEHYPDEITG